MSAFVHSPEPRGVSLPSSEGDHAFIQLSSVSSDHCPSLRRFRREPVEQFDKAIGSVAHLNISPWKP